MGPFVHLFCHSSNVREPRENRGRLRHCNGLQTPIATGIRREGGSEVKPEVRISVCLCSSRSKGCWRVLRVLWLSCHQPSTISHQPIAQLLRQEKDEASPPDCFRRGSSNAFIPRLAESEGFLLPRARARA